MAQNSLTRPSRRRFLQSALLGTTAASFPTYLRAQGANEAVRIAVIGTGGQGSGHVSSVLDSKKARLVAVCDADYNASDKNRAAADKKGVKINTYVDYRKLLENKDIDGIIIATPNHLHSMVAIHALQAGKHTYTEKPVSHNIWEGRQLALAAEKYPKLIAMHGMQSRSAAGWHEIAEFIKDPKGSLGKLLLSRGLCYKKRDNIGKCGGPQQPPPGVDYNLWSGPREMLPIMRKRFHYDWHWQWPYGNGDIGNQGPHQLDVARWMINDPAQSPATVMSIGGRFGYEDDATTANTQIAFFDFKPVPIIFEVRGLPQKNMDFGTGTPKFKFGASGIDVGNILHFEGGMILQSVAYDKDGKKVRTFGESGGGAHRSNYIDAIKDGKIKEPGHGVLGGHLSASLAHLANTSYRLGQTATPAAITEKIKGDANAIETFERMRQHLADNGVDIEKANPVLGPVLSFDGKTEKFTGEHADEANKVATESYRKEFSINV